MAVQQQGGLGFGQAQGQDHPPPATEYTLQGMRKLTLVLMLLESNIHKGLCAFFN